MVVVLQSSVFSAECRLRTANPVLPTVWRSYEGRVFSSRRKKQQLSLHHHKGTERSLLLCQYVKDGTQLQEFEKRSEGTLALPQSPDDVPILSGGGGGIFFFWQLGVLQHLQQRYDLSRVQLRGASAGALTATMAACDVNPERVLQTAYQLAVDNAVWERPMGLAGVWGGLVRAWLDDLLPADAHKRASGRLQLVVTEVPSFKQAYVQEYESKADLIEANMASVHVPFFLDGRPAAKLRGKPVIDGSFSDFIKWENSALLTCEGRAFVLDYSTDDQLKFSRLDFLKLRGYDETLELMEMGRRYAARLEAAGVLDRYFGAVKKQQRPALASSVAPFRKGSAAERVAGEGVGAAC